MSYLLASQDVEAAIASPWSRTGSMARQNTYLINGSWTARGGNNTASDGTLYYNASAPLLQRGSARGLRIRYRFQYQTRVQPSGGSIMLADYGAGTGGLHIATGTNKLKIYGTTGATALGNTTHDIAGLIMLQGGNNRHRVWLDGTEELDVTENSYIETFTILLWGVSAAGKCTWDALFDDIYIWVEYDPQP